MGEDIGGWTTLIIAATYGYKEPMEQRLENGADVKHKWT
jgi:hypothetical protein